MGNLFHYGMAMILCLAGFHGIFFYGSLAKKTAAWCGFQMGLILFLIQLTPSGAPLPLVLAIEVGVMTLTVTALLWIFCLKLHRRYKTLQVDEIVRRASK